MAIFQLAAFAEKGVGFVEKQNGPTLLCDIKNLAQILLGFPDILADHSAQIDAVEIQTQLVCQYFGGHSLANAASTCEKGANTQSSLSCVSEPPGVMDL